MLLSLIKKFFRLFAEKNDNSFTTFAALSATESSASEHSGFVDSIFSPFMKPRDANLPQLQNLTTPPNVSVPSKVVDSPNGTNLEKMVDSPHIITPPKRAIRPTKTPTTPSPRKGKASLSPSPGTPSSPNSWLRYNLRRSTRQKNPDKFFEYESEPEDK